MSRALQVCVGILFLAPSLVSCAADAVLYEKTSAYNTIIVTEDSRGLRTLLFERAGTRQSVVKPGDPDHLELAYARTALAGLALCAEPRRMLVVGLGGATLPMFLRRHYPDAVIDVAEIDPEVVDVAKKFFGFREDGRMRAHVGDGRRFIEATREPYDAIFLDAYGARTVPAHLTTVEFLRAASKAVAVSGVVIGNVWRPAFNPLYGPMLRTYQEVFQEIFVLDVPGDLNAIFLALPRRQALTQGELTAMASRLSAARRLPFDLGEAAGAGFLDAKERDPSVRVLRDSDLPAKAGPATSPAFRVR
jgi:spermidine synthase